MIFSCKKGTLLPFLHIPSLSVIFTFRHGITNLFPWQIFCSHVLCDLAAPPSPKLLYPKSTNAQFIRKDGWYPSFSSVFVIKSNVFFYFFGIFVVIFWCMGPLIGNFVYRTHLFCSKDGPCFTRWRSVCIGPGCCCFPLGFLELR